MTDDRPCIHGRNRASRTDNPCHGAHPSCRVTMPGRCPYCGPGYHYGDDGCRHTPPEESIMDHPDRATTMDVTVSIAEAETLKEAIGLAMGAASACWSNLGGAGMFDSTRCSQLVDAVMDRLYDEPDLARAREQELDVARQDRIHTLEERRTALELAVRHHQNLIDGALGTGISFGTVSTTGLAREFLEFLTGGGDADIEALLRATDETP